MERRRQRPGNSDQIAAPSQEFGAICSNYLPYVSILPAFAALQLEVKALQPNRQLDAQRKVRHWYWASVFLNRYSGSVESTTARDFLDFKAWIQDDNSEPPLIEEFGTRFRGIDLRNEVKARHQRLQRDLQPAGYPGRSRLDDR